MNMKALITVIACVVCIKAQAQLKATPACPPFAVDVLEGSISQKLTLRSTAGEVIKAFPCYTDSVSGTEGSCAGVFYKDKGISFFTERSYIEITDKFKGTLTPALLGADRGSLFRQLGNPAIKDAGWDAFQTQYGILVVYYNASGKINKLQLSSKSAETLKLCE